MAARPQLYPEPRSLVLESGSGAPADAIPSLRRDPTLPREGFRLRVADGAVAIDHADANGRRYAEGAWAQLCAQAGAAVPRLVVIDAPDFPVRGVMLDVSRDRVPTRETLARLVDLLALCRMNHLQLYTEHTFAYRDHETVWREASPLDAEDVRWLDARCSERGIELAANQNTFGHMERWLRHPAYRDRAECPEGWEAPGIGRRPPAVLAPTPENARFALGLVEELRAAHSSRRVNIGCDETFELGRGASRARVAAVGRGRVYLEHLQRLLAGVHAGGGEALFWGDILRNHPELVPELPGGDTVALAWHYEAPLDPDVYPAPLLEILASFGMTREALRGFAGQVPAFADHGRPFWVCPGTSSWNSLVGRLDNARANLLDAADVGGARGAGGYLVTDWGDNGHLQPFAVSIPPLVYGAAVAWGRERNRALDVAAVLDRLVFGDAAERLGAVLERVGNAYARTGRRGLNASPLQVALLQGGLLGAIGETDVGAVLALIEDLDEASNALGGAQPACADGAIVTRELAQAVRLARHGAWRMLREAGADAPADGVLRRDLAEAIGEQAACWRLRSREGGLGDSLARLEATLASYSA